jgi:hypothetical protein
LYNYARHHFILFFYYLKLDPAFHVHSQRSHKTFMDLSEVNLRKIFPFSLNQGKPCMVIHGSIDSDLKFEHDLRRVKVKVS